MLQSVPAPTTATRVRALARPPHDLFRRYDVGDFFDEAFEADGTPRAHYLRLLERLRVVTSDELANRELSRDTIFRRLGITFAVYG